MYNTMYNTMTAHITGRDCMGEPFAADLEFMLIPPKNEDYYGTGYYMRVKMPEGVHILDVRYAGTTDVEILADRFIASWYGSNAEEITKLFPNQ